MRTFTAWLSGVNCVFALLDARNNNWMWAAWGFISSVLLIVVFWDESTIDISEVNLTKKEGKDS